jgi:hypothetical protein
MTDIALTRREAEKIIGGDTPPGFADLIVLLAYLRASREAEPAPPMSAELLDQLADES